MDEVKVLSEERKQEILDDFFDWSAGHHPCDVSDERIEQYVDNCIYNGDEVLVYQWFEKMRKEDEEE